MLLFLLECIFITGKIIMCTTFSTVLYEADALNNYTVMSQLSIAVRLYLALTIKRCVKTFYSAQIYFINIEL